MIGKNAWAGLALIGLSAALCGQQPAPWVDLFNGKDLTGWGGRGAWGFGAARWRHLMGQCDPAKPCLPQSWLYTENEFNGDFDLSLEYWLRLGGNSGVSIGDRLRAKFAIDPKTGYPTPARSAYEVNIDNGPAAATTSPVASTNLRRRNRGFSGGRIGTRCTSGAQGFDPRQLEWPDGGRASGITGTP